MTIANRLTLYNELGMVALFRESSSSPLVLTLQGQTCAGSPCFFDYQIAPTPFRDVSEILLEIDNGDSNDPQLVLKWPTAADPGWNLVRLDDTSILANRQHVGNSYVFTFGLPSYPRFDEYRLTQPAPGYALKVTVKRKS